MTFYLLEDGQIRETTDVLEWARWFENIENRRIDYTELADGTYVSTVFLGVDHGFGLVRSPILYETMAFGPNSEWDCERAATVGQAKANHWAMVDRLRPARGETATLA